MKKIFKPLLLLATISMLSGCGVFNMVFEQNKENQKDMENLLHERSEKSKDSPSDNN